MDVPPKSTLSFLVLVPVPSNTKPPPERGSIENAVLVDPLKLPALLVNPSPAVSEPAVAGASSVTVAHVGSVPLPRDFRYLPLSAGNVEKVPPVFTNSISPCVKPELKPVPPLLTGNVPLMSVSFSLTHICPLLNSKPPLTLRSILSSVLSMTNPWFAFRSSDNVWSEPSPADPVISKPLPALTVLT